MEDFLEIVAAHAREAGERLRDQEASVQRFLQLLGDDFTEAGEPGGGREAGRMPASCPDARPASSPSPSAPRFLGIWFMLACGRSASGAERAQALDACRRRRARRRRRAPRPAACAREPGACRPRAPASRGCGGPVRCRS